MQIHIEIATKHCESDDLCVTTFIVEHPNLSEIETLIADMVDSVEDDETNFDVTVTEYRPPTVCDIGGLKRALYENWEWEPNPS